MMIRDAKWDGGLQRLVDAPGAGNAPKAVQQQGALLSLEPFKSTPDVI